MIENQDIKKPSRYVCFHCIAGSTDPDVCTSCGAAIEEYDFESAVLVPPRAGRYYIAFGEIAQNIVMSALNVAKINFLQRFVVEANEIGVDIQSLDMAYDRLIEVLSSMTGISVETLKQAIIFET